MLRIVILILLQLWCVQCNEQTTMPTSSTESILSSEYSTNLVNASEKSSYQVIEADHRPRFLSVLHSFFRVFRFIFREIFEAYNLYHPEIRFCRCLFTFARTEYPELQQRFTLNNLRKSTQRMFEDIYTYFSDLVNDDQSDEWINRKRIANKVLQLSDKPELFPIIVTSKFENRMGLDRMHGSNSFVTQRKDPKSLATRRIDGKPIRRVAYMSPRSLHYARNTKLSPMEGRSTMYMGSRQFVAPTVPIIHEQNDEPMGDTLEELFDFDSVLYESLGIDKKQMKPWTPIYCTKEYVVLFLKRFILGVLIGTH